MDDDITLTEADADFIAYILSEYGPLNMTDAQEQLTHKLANALRNNSTVNIFIDC